MKRSSVARRIFITLTLLFATVVGLVAVSMYFTVARTVEAAVLGNITRDMALAARDFEIWLSGKIGTLETLRHAVLRFGNKPEIIHQLLVDASRADPDIPWIYYGTAELDPPSQRAVGDGFVRSGRGYYLDGSGWTPGERFDWTQRAWFQQSKAYPEIGRAHV